MLSPICPVCGATIDICHTPWCCANGHTYDVARQGYVNLLLANQKHALHPGDTKQQVAARRRFLDAGFYAPIQKQVLDMLLPHLPGHAAILDAGCGEGYYGAALAQAAAPCDFWGIDISKDAVRYAAVRCGHARWVTATAAKLPFAPACFDAVMSMFALTVPGEFHRVLKPNGLFLQVLAGEDHLRGLKKLIYPELLQREKQHPVPEGFTLLEQKTLSFDFTLSCTTQILDLLSMTPHYWRITKQGAQAAAQSTFLQDTAQVRFALFQAKPPC